MTSGSGSSLLGDSSRNCGSEWLYSAATGVTTRCQALVSGSLLTVNVHGEEQSGSWATVKCQGHFSAVAARLGWSTALEGVGFSMLAAMVRQLCWVPTAERNQSLVFSCLVSEMKATDSTSAWKPAQDMR